MKRQHFYVITAFLLIAIAATFAAKVYTKHREVQEDQKAINSLIQVMNLPQDANPAQMADYVRGFIWRNSTHNIDDEFRSHWGNTPLIVSKMIAYTQGERADPPHMECSSRSGLVQTILESLGYRVRSVDIYRHAANFPGHSFIEMMNPQTQRWEIIDTDYNLFWIRADKVRAGIADIVAANTQDDVTPCRTSEQCGWDIDSPSRNLKDIWPYYGLAVTIDRKADERVLLVDKTRFPLDKPVAISDRGDMTYCAYRGKNCRGPIIIY